MQIERSRASHGAIIQTHTHTHAHRESWEAETPHLSVLTQGPLKKQFQSLKELTKQFPQLIYIECIILMCAAGFASEPCTRHVTLAARPLLTVAHHADDVCACVCGV